jgi:hypothetical protein
MKLHEVLRRFDIKDDGDTGMELEIEYEATLNRVEKTPEASRSPAQQAARLSLRRELQILKESNRKC